ncbi:ATP synthase subunit I [Gorillibacterium massiliense]|uniref:ATP synthase subunit I n=1 Tax=Gorillibacterium massiliense TaxID=1280390 RepID=UPI0005927C94|nr:ATP synthase subunit I [Gorillibacterium massiliense]
MDDLATLVRRVIRIAFYFIVICAAVGLFIPSIRSLSFGLCLGTLASIAITWHLGRKTESFTRNLVESTGKRVGLGFITRICIALAVVAIAVKEPHVDLVGVVIGLVFIHFVIIISGIFSAFTK